MTVSSTARWLADVGQATVELGDQSLMWMATHRARLE